MILFRFLTFFVFTFIAISAHGQDCAKANLRIPIEISLASASIVSNYWGLQGSINRESGKLLINAEKIAKLAEHEKLVCPKGCQASDQAQVIFEAIPNKYMDDANCQELYKKTSVKPLVFQSEPSSSLEQVTDQFVKLSRGDGINGERLYLECPGNCSPQYQIQLSQENNIYQSTIFVICGAPRDKQDNQYKLSTSFVWSCY